MEGTTSCGLNLRGALWRECQDNRYTDTTECDDPDACVDGNVTTGITACGLNGRGLYDRHCVVGQWQDSATCVDPDECVDGTQQSTDIACGLTPFDGHLFDRCESGAWQASTVCSAPTALEMVKDIYEGATNSSPRLLAAFTGGVLFSANDGASGSEPWVSDGTAEGTSIVANLTADATSSSLTYSSAVGDVAAFTANGVSSDYRVLATSGTGTVELKTGITSVPKLARVGGVLFFEANGDLYRSDGTFEGTTLITSVGGNAYGLTPSGTRLFFAVGNAVWVSDGTPAGTLMLVDIPPAPENPDPRNLADVNGVLFFTTSYSAWSAIELWTSDGTPSGTRMVKIVDRGGSSNRVSHPCFAGIQGRYYFMASTFNSGNASVDWEPWVSNGTAAGTVRIANVNTSGSSNPCLFTSFEDKVYFVAEDNTSGRELWQTDGTAANTVLVKDINSGANNSVISWLQPFAGRLLFGADDDVNGNELWVSDGTGDGTQLLADINSGSASSAPDSPLIWNDMLFFTANDGTYGRELWALR